MRKLRRTGGLMLATALLLVPALVPAPASATSRAGVVFTMSNSADGNEILAFDRDADGGLSFGGAFATGGQGTGTGLGNQNGIVLSRSGRWLLAVNAGSDDISSFRVKAGSIELRDVEDSNGDRPISLTLRGRLLYVLNDESGGNVTGFRVRPGGELSPISGSTQPVDGIAPAQIEFSPDGDHLVVTEKDTNTIAVYPVVNRRAQAPTSHPSNGATPFGFAFDKHDRLIVSEAFGGAPGASAVSSYDFDDGSPQVISGSVPTNQTAACWIVVTRNGRYAYTSNTGSGSLTGYSVAPDGQLTSLNADGVTASTGAGPIDMALSRSSRFLYSLDSGDHQISGFEVNSDGSLTPLGALGDLPDAANGLAAR